MSFISPHKWDKDFAKWPRWFKSLLLVSIFVSRAGERGAGLDQLARRLQGILAPIHGLHRLRRCLKAGAAAETNAGETGSSRPARFALVGPLLPATRRQPPGLSDGKTGSKVHKSNASRLGNRPSEAPVGSKLGLVDVSVTRPERGALLNTSATVQPTVESIRKHFCSKRPKKENPHRNRRGAA